MGKLRRGAGRGIFQLGERRETPKPVPGPPRRRGRVLTRMNCWKRLSRASSSLYSFRARVCRLQNSEYAFLSCSALAPENWGPRGHRRGRTPRQLCWPCHPHLAHHVVPKQPIAPQASSGVPIPSHLIDHDIPKQPVSPRLSLVTPPHPRLVDHDVPKLPVLPPASPSVPIPSLPR